MSNLAGRGSSVYQGKVMSNLGGRGSSVYQGKVQT